MASEGKVMPAAVGAEKLPDPCLEPCREWFDSDKKMAHADLGTGNQGCYEGNYAEMVYG